MSVRMRYQDTQIESLVAYLWSQIVSSSIYEIFKHIQL
jgi:hypothetical protein